MRRLCPLFVYFTVIVVGCLVCRRPVTGFVIAPSSSTWTRTTRISFTSRRRSSTSSDSDSSSSSSSDRVLTDNNEKPTPSPTVQRKYETYLWMHEGHEYDINYRVQGPLDGPPLLLVHGFGANVNHFRFQFETLPEKGYRVYAIDLLGFGASDKPADAPYSIELFTKLVQDFILTMNSKDPWMIAGNSIGGLTCLCVAQELVSQIGGVILFNCAGGMTGFRYEDVAWFARPLLYFVQNVVLGPSFGGRFFANFKTRENVESILLQQGVYGDTTNLLDILLGPADDEGAQQVFLRVFAGPPGPTPESVLPGIQAPILGIWGSADPWTPVDQGTHPGKNFGQYCENFELHVLDGVGHCPHDEAPDRVHAVMLPWMKAVSQRYDPRS